MMHLRGNPLDFNNWATITSDPSWGYEGVLSYFIQSEHFVGETTDSKLFNMHYFFKKKLQVISFDRVLITQLWQNYRNRSWVWWSLTNSNSRLHRSRKRVELGWG